MTTPGKKFVVHPGTWSTSAPGAYDHGTPELASWMIGPLLAHCTTAGHGELDSDTLAANRALDQAFLDAHAQKSTDALLSLFSTRPDVVFIAPNGTVNHGRDEIRGSFSRFFALLEEIHGEITTAGAWTRLIFSANRRAIGGNGPRTKTQ